MATPVTAKFSKMRIWLGAYSDLVVPVVSVSNTLPAICTVSAANIPKFIDGNQVTILGITEPNAMDIANGTWVIASANVPPNTFTLTGVDCTGGAYPATIGITATVKNVAGGVTYMAPCGLVSKNCTINKNLSEHAIKNCQNPSAPMWLGREVESLSCSITGEGVAAAESVPYWHTATLSIASVPMKVEVEFAIGRSTITGLFHVTSQAFGAETGERVSLGINAQSDGDCTAVWSTTAL
jgi:hypothetical protein